MKPFDIEAAKRGEPVQTEDGRPVRIICFDRKIGVRGCEILYLVSDNDYETLRAYPSPVAERLVMAPVKRMREVWISVYSVNTILHHCKEDADRAALAGRLACIPVTLEWEE